MRQTVFAVLMLGGLSSHASVVAQNGVRVGGHYVVQFDQERGGSLIEFIALAEVILGQPIEQDREEVASVRLHVAGPVTIPHDDFDQFFQAVLRAYDFVVVETGTEGARTLSVRRIIQDGVPGHRGGGCQAPLVPAESLYLYSGIRATLITTTVPLEHMDPCNAMRALAPVFGTQLDQVRSANAPNSLTLTGFGTNVWRASQLLALLDVPTLPARR